MMIATAKVQEANNGFNINERSESLSLMILIKLNKRGSEPHITYHFVNIEIGLIK
ncbi:hypothetical protein HMP0015_0870 [Acinetobacter haemolyticus ATCC 19194]|uniref:Uncharacterized protein n=1 Tax=Acinetobacter haemolyticus ATCC 19194 TaxID=707232 RepID=D4XMC8_ACIHA|nr:hypothetical protein HMP0015_0870 [Acinetobacter haemolyticus ATCC 19194]